MTDDELKSLIEAGVPDSTVFAQGDGYHFTVRVIAPCFEGQSTVKRQQCVYAAVNEQIQSGDLHAITIKTFTPTEWTHHATHD